jgi:hypothetical protein
MYATHTWWYLLHAFSVVSFEVDKSLPCHCWAFHMQQELQLQEQQAQLEALRRESQQQCAAMKAEVASYKVSEYEHCVCALKYQLQTLGNH